MIFVFDNVENSVGEKEKMLVTSIFTFYPKCFLKVSFYWFY